MNRVTLSGWRPLLFALAGVLLGLALALGSSVQAGHLFQTVPTRTPKPSPPTETRTPVPPRLTSTPLPPGSTEAPTSTATTATSLPEQAVSGGGQLTLRLGIDHQDVLPGETVQFDLEILNPSDAAATGISLLDSLDPAFELLRVSASQGMAEVEGQTLTIRLGTVEAGQAALVTIEVEVRETAQTGQIILNQVTAAFDGGTASSDVMVAGLPPAELPATGAERRVP